MLKYAGPGMLIRNLKIQFNSVYPGKEYSLTGVVTDDITDIRGLFYKSYYNTEELDNKIVENQRS